MMWKLGVVGLLPLVMVLGADVVGAQDADTLIKQINTELRGATGKMFNGKYPEAAEQLATVKQLLEQLKAADPGNSRIKGFESKIDKLDRDIQRRMPKDDAPDTPDTPEKPDTPATPAGTEEKLPSPVKRGFDRMHQELDRLEEFLSKVNPRDPESASGFDNKLEARVKGVEAAIGRAEEEATKRGFGEHAELARARERLAADQEKAAKIQALVNEAEAAAAESAKGAVADYEALKAEYDRLQGEYFGRASGGAIYYNDLDPAQELLEFIQKFERDELPALRDRLAQFEGTYGSTEEEIEKNMYAAGYDGGYNPSDPWDGLTQGIDGVAKTRVAMAADLLAKGEQRMANQDAVGGFHKVEYLLKTKEWFLLAAAFDPESEAVASALPTVDPRIKEHIAAFHEQIDKVKWPSHADNAPSNAKDLAKVVKEWFEKSPDWGKRKTAPRHVLAVIVTGPWSVQETNLLGEPLNYGLPVRVCVQLDSEKDMDLARVYELTMRTFRSRDPKMEPPFEYPTVGGSFYIRASKVK